MTPDPSDLARRFADRKATVGIVGMGYVGLPLMLAATASGFRVLGFDIDLVKIEGLNAGRSPLKHIGDAPVQAARAAGLFEATADLTRSAEAEAILICVPTPLARTASPISALSRARHGPSPPISARVSSSSWNPRPGPARPARS